MNTLSKKITNTFFKQPEGYAEMRRSWAERMKKREEVPTEVHLLYLVLSGKDWRKGYQLGNRDLSNGQDYNTGVYRAITHLHYELSSTWAKGRVMNWFPEVVEKDLFAEDVRQKLINLLPDQGEVLRAIHGCIEMPGYKGV